MKRRLAACAALVLVAAGCRERVPEAWPQAPVILVSIDTLRADRVGAYGYGKGTTPHLDALAREGVVFERAISPVPLTLPAHATLLTGRLPPRHGVRDNLGFALPAAQSTLATRFRAAGRPTGAAVSSYVMRAATGLAAGFELYDDALTVDAATASLGAQQRDGAVAVESLARWIETQRERPFFAFLHLYEPHTPYAPPEPFRSRFGDPYDGEVAYADELLGKLLARLRAAGLHDSAVIAVTSDHGEMLGEHGEQEHGFFLYRAALEVPLVLRLPGGAHGGRRVAAPAGLADVAPTLLELVGLPAGETDGASLRPAIAGAPQPARPQYSETLYPRLHFGWSELFAVTDERFRHVRAPRPELFDLKTDRAESRNLAAERESVVAAMSAWLDGIGTAGETAAPAPVSAEAEEALRSLGYVGGGRAPQPAAGSTLADPKDKIGVYEDFRRATGLRRAGDEAAAIAALRDVVRREPGMLDAWEALGTALHAAGQERDAIAAFDRVLRGDPGRAAVHLALSRIHALGGRVEVAARHATAAASGDPGRAFETLAELMLQRGRLADAVQYAQRSVAADPQRVAAHFVLGVEARQAGRCADALLAFDRAEVARARHKGLVVPGLHAGRGDCLARLGREAEAEQAFREELAALPYSREGRLGLALLQKSAGRDADAAETLVGLVREHPAPAADDYWTVVRTLAAFGERKAASGWAEQARARFPADPRFRG